MENLDRFEAPLLSFADTISAHSLLGDSKKGHKHSDLAESAWVTNIRSTVVYVFIWLQFLG